MKLTFALVALAMLPPCEAISQAERDGCPVKNERTAMKLLLDNKANSEAADPRRVDAAFATLSFATAYRGKNYVKFLVSMLDFERSVTEIEYADGRANLRYPAMGDLSALQGLGKNVVPYLINGIRESDSEVLRTNAGRILGEINYCKALKVLSRAAETPVLPFEQKERLEAAEKQIRDWDPNEFICSCAANSP